MLYTAHIEKREGEPDRLVLRRVSFSNIAVHEYRFTRDTAKALYDYLRVVFDADAPEGRKRELIK
jgi:hypothetical protein